MSFSESCISNGRKPSSHVISCCIMEVEDWQNEFLQLKGDQSVYHIERVLSADDLPIIYEHIYLPVSSFPQFQVGKLEDGSLVRVLEEEYQITESEKGRSTIEVRTATQSVAQYLRMNIGEPVMIMTSYMNDSRENPLYISYEIIAGSRYRISI